jgi:hypothetical protein
MITIIILASILELTSCNNITVTRCVANTTCDTNISLEEPSKSVSTKKNLKKEKFIDSLRCLSEPDGTSEYILVSETSDRRKALMGFVTGSMLWGDGYSQKSRCEETKRKIIIGLRSGADALSSGFKYGYPIICASIDGSCLRDSNGEIIEIIRLRKSTNAARIAQKFNERVVDSTKNSSYDSIPLI